MLRVGAYLDGVEEVEHQVREAVHCRLAAPYARSVPQRTLASRVWNLSPREITHDRIECGTREGGN